MPGVRISLARMRRLAAGVPNRLARVTRPSSPLGGTQPAGFSTENLLWMVMRSGRNSRTVTVVLPIWLSAWPSLTVYSDSV
jgi:hypothetical protein